MVRFRFNLLSVLIAILLLSAVFALMVRYNQTYGDIAFEAEQWNEALPGRDLVRSRMLADLMANYLPVGMKEADVFAIIGDPSGNEDEWRRWSIYDDRRRFGDVTLAIRFDKQRRILAVYSYEHS